MYIRKELLHSDYENPQEHLKEMLKSALKLMNSEKNNHRLDYYDSLDTLKCINDFCLVNDIEGIDFSGKHLDNNTILNILNSYYTDHIFNNSSNSFIHHFNKSKYEFTEEEYQNIQETINQLRNDIQQSTVFGEEHQERLLKKLEELQQELHKKMNKLDKVQGQLLSIGATLGQFGEKTKPMFDRINETLRVVLRTEQKGDNIVLPENQLEHEDIIPVEVMDKPQIEEES